MKNDKDYEFLRSKISKEIRLMNDEQLKKLEIYIKKKINSLNKS